MSRQRGSRVLRIVLSVALTVLAFALLFRSDIALDQVWAELSSVRLPWVGATLVSLMTYHLVKAARWKLILDRSGAPVPLRESFIVILIGQTLNTLLPFRVGDVARLYLMGRHGVRHGVVLGTLIVEKGSDLLCYSALFFCSPGTSRCRAGPAQRCPPCSPSPRPCW